MNQTVTIPYPHADADITASVLMAVKLLLVVPFGALAASLVLYLTHQMHLPDFTAISVIAFVLGSTGLLRIAAGLIADRYLNHCYLLLLSAFFMFIGCVLTAIPQFIYWGMSSIALGSACTIAVNCLLTNMFQQDDIKREDAFLRNYSAMNVGYIISFIISGYFELHQQYQLLFMVASGFSMLALLLIIFRWGIISGQDKTIQTMNTKQNLIGIFLILIMFISLYVLIKIASAGEFYFQIFNIIVCVGAFAYSINKVSTKKKNDLLTYFIFIIPALIFSTIHYLTPMTLTLFIERNVDRNYLGIIIPPQWVQLIGNTAIIIGGPLLCYLFDWLRKRGIKINTALQFSAGLVLIGASLLVIAAGILLSKTSNQLHFNWIMISNLLQGISELFIVPIGFAMIANIAPSCSRGTMMGIWLLLLSMGAVFAGLISNMVSDVSISFMLLGSFAVISGLIIVLFGDA